MGGMAADVRLPIEKNAPTIVSRPARMPTSVLHRRERLAQHDREPGCWCRRCDDFVFGPRRNNWQRSRQTLAGANGVITRPNPAAVSGGQPERQNVDQRCQSP